MTKTNRQEVWRIAALVSAVLIALIANLLGPLCCQETMPFQLLLYGGYLAAGGLVAQPCLLALWAGFGPQSIMLRWPITLGLLIVGTCAFLQGLRLSLVGRVHVMPLDVVFAVWLAALIAFCIVQTPLWILRGAFGWRIELSDAIQKNGANRPLQFDLKYLLALTAVIGVLLALIRQSLPAYPANGEWWPDVGGLLQVAVVLLVVAILCTTLFLPCVWVVLLDKPATWSLLWLGAILSLGPLGLLQILAIAFGGGLSASGPFLACLYAFIFGLALTVLGCLLTTRALGYRLINAHDATSNRETNASASS